MGISVCLLLLYLLILRTTAQAISHTTISYREILILLCRRCDFPSQPDDPF